MGLMLCIIGLMIWQNPLVWGHGFIDDWALKILPIPVLEFMQGIAVFDFTLGLLLLFNIYTHITGLIVGVHILSVLIVSGIDEVTVRNVGLAAAGFALFFTKVRKLLR
jgi:hypothetical protein